MSGSDEGLLSQDDINAALAAAGLGGSAEASADSGDSSALDIDAAFSASSVVAEAAPAAGAVDATSVRSFDLPELSSANSGPGEAKGIDLLRDVELNVKIELGRTRMLVDDVLRLGEGAVVELDKLAGDPVDVFVNNHLVARGEVLVLNDNFCVRINEIVARNGEDGWV